MSMASLDSLGGFRRCIAILLCCVTTIKERSMMNKVVSVSESDKY